MVERSSPWQPVALAALAALAVSGVAARAQAPIDPHLDIPIGGGPIDVGPVPAGLDAVDAASCGECHERHYREWAGSAHRTASTNALFLAELGPRRRAFCVDCHAPRRDASAGVDCAVCHVREGAVLNPRVSGRAPHASRAAPELAGTLACARCHQFEFEGQPGELLQRTTDEWMASAHRGTSCQGCHLPERGGHHRHDFPGGLDEELLRDAIRVEARATREGETTRLHLELSADRAGHAVPTGDIFRRLEIRAWPAGEPDRVVSTVLGRRFRVDRTGWHEREDRRVPPTGALSVELALEGAAARVAYSVELWRTMPERARRLGWSPRDVRRRLSAGVVRVE